MPEARLSPTPAAWDGLAAAIAADRMLLGPEAAALVVLLIDGAERVGRRDSIRLSGPLRALRAIASRVATGRSGHPDIRSTTESPSWRDDEISTTAAAELLGCSREHANRLARDGVLGPTRKAGNRRLVSRAHVNAYLIERNQER